MRNNESWGGEICDNSWNRRGSEPREGWPRSNWGDRQRSVKPASPLSDKVIVAPGFHAPYSDSPAIITVAVLNGWGRPGVFHKRLSSSDCYRAQVASVAFALEGCREGEPVVLVTTKKMAHFIKRLIPIWRRKDWKNARGKPLAADVSWQKIAERMEALDVEMVVVDEIIPDVAMRLRQHSFERAKVIYDRSIDGRGGRYNWN